MAKNRKLALEIMRYDPLNDSKGPFMQKFEIAEKENQSVLAVLREIRDYIDPSLRFDAVCRSSMCGSCAMMINGRPGLACKTPVSSLPKKIILHPLPYFRMAGDLTVDTGIWFRGMYDRVGSWIHSSDKDSDENTDFRFSDSVMKDIYDLERCIECGCCIASCATANMSDKFLTAAGLLRAARFLIDPRDSRSSSQWYEIIGTDDGMFGCTAFLACNDFCPKNIPLQKTLSMLRRKMILAGIFGKGGANEKDRI